MRELIETTLRRNKHPEKSAITLKYFFIYDNAIRKKAL